jgi:hypothetical protein
LKVLQHGTFAWEDEGGDEANRCWGRHSPHWSLVISTVMHGVATVHIIIGNFNCHACIARYMPWLHVCETTARMMHMLGDERRRSDCAFQSHVVP